MHPISKLTATPEFTAVITSIQQPTASVFGLLERLSEHSAPCLIIGDEKGPFAYDAKGAELWTIDAQKTLPFRFSAVAPVRHYSRKNIGYLIAISRGAPCIYETDDDNAPNDHWSLRTQRTQATRLEQAGWVNVYRGFSNDLIWPRGFPLERVRDETTFPRPAGEPEAVDAPIQQGLADLSPDIDAVWRLILDREFSFDRRPSLMLPKGAWCPFNSQTTWWWPVAYPLLYLPSYCSFRMTDIWRSFVAQRCLWELGHGMVFHSAEAIQQRNEHSLIRDFEAEVPGYLQNVRLAAILEGLTLEGGVESVGRNLRCCYAALAEAKIMPADELVLVDAWLADLDGPKGTV